MPTKKLVIHTQHRENYGSHDWDGEGKCPQYWKNKGGSTYTVYGITPKMEDRIERDGLPTLRSLIETSNDYFIEDIINIDIVDESEMVVEDWEHEYVLSYDRTSKEWVCNVEREPYIPSDMFDRIRESWIPANAGERKPGSFVRSYRIPSGEWVPENIMNASAEPTQ